MRLEHLLSGEDDSKATLKKNRLVLRESIKNTGRRALRQEKRPSSERTKEDLTVP